VLAGEGSRGRLLQAQQRAFYEEALGSDAEALATWRTVKDRRHGTYMAEAWSTVGSDMQANEVPSEPPPDDGPGEAGYGAIAAAFIRSVASGEAERMILDTPNAGRMPFLPDDAVIEAPCIAGERVEPVPAGDLPPEQRELVARMKEMERTTIRAARTGSAALALDAIAAHPVVPSREVAERILAGYLARQPGLREVLR
jgi:6-phospho-beta-glucosidase